MFGCTYSDYDDCTLCLHNPVSDDALVVSSQLCQRHVCMRSTPPPATLRLQHQRVEVSKETSVARVKGEVGAFTWLGASTSRAFPSNVSVYLDQKKFFRPLKSRASAPPTGAAVFLLPILDMATTRAKDDFHAVAQR